MRYLIVLIAWFVLFTDANAGQWLPPAIRAAQLFEADGHWQSVAPRSPREEQAEIRAHFVAVERLLVESAAVSLDTAVARFEHAGALPLDAASRDELRSQLATRRSVQLERLRGYSRAGSFPLNRHYVGEARPIFVDASGTHCAVGHLMAMDGLEREVNAIARAKPSVLVREVNDGPLVSWVLTSGLTQEEAALIQPAYYPNTGDATKLSDLIVPGASMDLNGFRYENFAFSSSSTGGATTPTAGQVGLVYGWPPVATASGFCGGYSATCVPRPNTLWISAYESPSNFGYLSTGRNQTITFDIEYDVVALTDGMAIGGTRTFANLLYGGFQTIGGVATLTTALDSGVLGELALSFTQFIGSGDQSILFAAPVDQMHVRHRVQLGAGASFGSFDSQLLSPVPAPGSMGLLALSVGVLLRRVRRAGS
ncbi:MAG: hypothetical protein ABIX37_10440 [Gammaproteobacteria bacterium]